MKYSQIKKLSKDNIPPGEEGARLAAQIREYIKRKNKLIRVALAVSSGCLLVLLIFVIIGRGTSLYDDYPVAFWTVTGVLGALFVAAAVAVAVNMVTFSRFLKRFN